MKAFIRDMIILRNLIFNMFFPLIIASILVGTVVYIFINPYETIGLTKKHFIFLLLIMHLTTAIFFLILYFTDYKKVIASHYYEKRVAKQYEFLTNRFNRTI